MSYRLANFWLASFDFVFHASEQIDCSVRVTTNPPVMQFFDWKGIDVIPSKTPFTLHNDKVGFFEDA
jgi:hypothetical protein